MPILTIALLVLAALGPLSTLVVLTVVLLTMGLLVDWFRNRAAQVNSDPDKVAVTVADAIESGDVSYIQGIFDTEKGEFTEARRIKASRVDGDVQQAHSKHKVAIWE